MEYFHTIKEEGQEALLLHASELPTTRECTEFVSGRTQLLGPGGPSFDLPDLHHTYRYHTYAVQVPITKEVLFDKDLAPEVYSQTLHGGMTEALYSGVVSLENLQWDSIIVFRKPLDFSVSEANTGYVCVGSTRLCVLGYETGLEFIERYLKHREED